MAAYLNLIHAHRMIFKLLCAFILFLSCNPNNEPIFDLNIRPSSTEMFAEGVVSTSLFERDMAITPDGTEIIYTVGDLKQTRRSLVSRKLIDGEWTRPEILSFSGQYQDIEPFFDVKGGRLFFASNRPLLDSVHSKDYDIWYVNRSSDGWLSPQRLGNHINTKRDEFYPSLSASGNLYFTATREDGIGREDLFVSKFENGSYGHPQVLDAAVNTPFYEFNAYINPDENLLIFSSFGRADDMGGGDLYFSRKNQDGQWSNARNMGPSINSVNLDYCPFIDTPRGNFYFTSDRVNEQHEIISQYSEIWDLSISSLNGGGNIYRINVDSIDIKRDR